ncbi:alpha/beta hydrolase fold domain-containing protein [Streptomyces sp. WELS2]|uniref:alpha/beta hydrolase fold domain-containing protein n=1 Tax=Streptomyces sp. WELS2 TaxID=2749435 RepID=UPI0015F03FD7|nr:alpha/beta hydrolase fold domain-containing protein [Streptomyces sp. WELS2]
MSDLGTPSLNVEFGRLAVARRLAGAPVSADSPARGRIDAERWISRFGSAPGPEDDAAVEARDHSVVIRPRREAADSPWVMYVHGGGMVYYSTAVFRPFLRTLAEDLRAPVEAFDYLKAPEHTAEESVKELAAHVAERCRDLAGRRLVLAGDSVGGLLALYLSLRVLPGVFSRVVLIYPFLDPHTERESYRIFGEGHFLDRDSMRLFKSVLAPFCSMAGFDPMALPPDDIARLPPCSVVTAGCDVLRDEGLAWVEQMTERRADVRHRHFPDLPHDFCLYAGKLTSARNAVAAIARTAFPSNEES